MWCVENLAIIGDVISYVALVAVGIAVIFLLSTDHRWSLRGTEPNGLLNLGLIGFGSIVAALLTRPPLPRHKAHGSEELTPWIIAGSSVVLPSILLFLAAFAALRSLTFVFLRLRIDSLQKLETPLSPSALERQNLQISRWLLLGSGVWIGSILVAGSSLVFAGVQGRCSKPSPSMPTAASAGVPAQDQEEEPRGALQLAPEETDAPENAMDEFSGAPPRSSAKTYQPDEPPLAETNTKEAP